MIIIIIHPKTSKSLDVNSMKNIVKKSNPLDEEKQ